MFSALFVLLIISIFAVQLHFFARQAKSGAFRFQTSEVARQLAAAAMEEAFAHVLATSENPDGSFYRLMVERSNTIDCSRLAPGDKNLRGIEVPVELTQKQAESLATKFSVNATARIMDFRGNDMSATGYYGQEGVGTLELRVVVAPDEAFKDTIKSGCTMTRHHDYKVAAIVAKRDNTRQRESYAGSYVLDYALFIRNGQAEFDNSAGASLNPPRHRLVIGQGAKEPAGFGKVFFGNRPGKAVYLNIDSDRMHFVPAPHQKEFFYNPADQQVFRLLPDFYAAVKRLAASMFPEIELSYGNFVMTNFAADFLLERLPICDKDFVKDDSLTGILEIRNALALKRWPQASDPPAAQTGAGLIIEPEENLAQILEGDVRQRFLQIASFFVELADARIFAGPSSDTDLDSRRIDDQKLLEDFSTRKFACFNPENFSGRQPYGIDTGYLRSHIYRDLREEDIFSRLDTTCSYQLPPATSLPQPVFYLKRWAGRIEDPSLAAVPFAHINLWARQRLSRRQLEEFGIYNPALKKLKLRGIIACREPIVLGAEGEIEAEGCGILIAPGIRIENGIRKSQTKETICVLATRGQPIVVNTDRKIEASLVSMGILDRNGHIRASRRLDLSGALVVDQLAIERWAPDVEHRITYDPSLKRQEDLYQINISRWTTFERVLERDE
jgi:hypothetical protein